MSLTQTEMAEIAAEAADDTAERLEALHGSLARAEAHYRREGARHEAAWRRHWRHDDEYMMELFAACAARAMVLRAGREADAILAERGRPC